MQENGYRYSGIEGCDYEPHYKYTLLIKNTTIANPPADAASIHSKLIKIIEKKRTIVRITKTSIRDCLEY